MWPGIALALTGLSKAEVPWKWIAVALVALGLGLTIFFGYQHVQNLSKDLMTAQTELAEQRVLKQAAEARANAILTQHDVQVQRIQALEEQRSSIAVEVTKLRSEMSQLNLQQDLESDDDKKADAAIDRLNAGNARLGRLLNDASAGKAGAGSRAGPRGQARKAGPSAAYLRAIQALRKNGVSDAH